MSPPRTAAPSYAAPNFKASPNVVTLCSRLKNEKCTWFSLCSVELYLSLNIIIMIFLVFFFKMLIWFGATKLEATVQRWGDFTCYLLSAVTRCCYLNGNTRLNYVNLRFTIPICIPLAIFLLHDLTYFFTQTFAEQCHTLLYVTGLPTQKYAQISSSIMTQVFMRLIFIIFRH